jgi:small-conductance mechanosensitive channel
MLAYFTQLISDYFGHQQISDLLRQVMVIVSAILLAWGLSRWILSYWLRVLRSTPESERATLQTGMMNFVLVFTPILLMVILLIAKVIMGKLDYSVSLWKIVMPLVISQIVIRLVAYISRRLIGRDSTQISSDFTAQFNKAFSAFIWVCVALYITGVWHGVMLFLEGAEISLGRYKFTVLTMLQATVSVLITLVMALWVSAIVEDRLMKVGTMHSSLRTAVARMVRASLILVAFLVSLSMVGIDLTVLSVFGGALGVGLGLGMQKIASSYVSGFVILLERSLSIGDMVNVDTYFGKVTQINTRYTVLEGLDGIESVLPNEIFISSAVQNYSLTHRIIRLSTNFTILYQDNIEEILSELEKAALSVERVSRQNMPQAFLIKLGQDGLDIEIGFWITDPENGRLNVLSDVNRAVWRTLQAHGVLIAHPKREIRLMDQRSFEQNFTVSPANPEKVG